MSDNLGKADWIYECIEGVWLHMPCCSRWNGVHRCSNGPLTGAQIADGDCGEHVTERGSDRVY